jgi:hypothetical protein
VSTITSQDLYGRHHNNGRDIWFLSLLWTLSQRPLHGKTYWHFCTFPECPHGRTQEFRSCHWQCDTYLKLHTDAGHMRLTPSIPEQGKAMFFVVRILRVRDRVKKAKAVRVHKFLWKRSSWVKPT